MSKVKATCVSKDKGKKSEVQGISLKKDFGVIGDFHAGSKRQVSLLSKESIDRMREKGLKLGHGDFGENIVTEGIDIIAVGIGAKLGIGSEAVIEITDIGKKCIERCEIYYQAGDCIMPKEGIFAKVLIGGNVKNGDDIKIL